MELLAPRVSTKQRKRAGGVEEEVMVGPNIPQKIPEDG